MGKLWLVKNWSIFKLQKKAIRICTGSHFLAHTDPLFYKLKTLKKIDLNTTQVVVIMVKYINTLLPLSFDNMIRFNSSFHSFSTRIFGNKSQLSITLKPVRHSGPDIWNSFKDTMSLLQPTSNSVELCRNYEYFMYVLSKNLNVIAVS